jgi:hypothetical protein
VRVITRFRLSLAHWVGRHNGGVPTRPCLYLIRIEGRLGQIGLSAFPSMKSDLIAGDTVLTGWLEDSAALFGVIAQIEGLALELLELRRLDPSTAARTEDDSDAGNSS